MNSRIVRSSMLMILCVGVFVPTLVRAQGSDSLRAVLTMQPILTNLPSVGTGPALGAVIAPVGVTRSMAMAPVSIPAASLAAGEGVGKSRAMMGVGLAAVVIGIIVGGDIGTLFIVGGGVIGLIGLYNYMY